MTWNDSFLENVCEATSEAVLQFLFNAWHTTDVSSMKDVFNEDLGCESSGGVSLLFDVTHMRVVFRSCALFASQGMPSSNGVYLYAMYESGERIFRLEFYFRSVGSV